MSQNTYCSPRLIINGEPVHSTFTAKIDIKGSNTINTSKIVVNNEDLKEYKLLNEEVEIYANIGSIDNVPIFRGYITKVKPQQGKVMIDASDPRYFLSGRNSVQWSADETHNAEGMTVVTLLYKFIKDYINTDKTYIGLDMLRETDPVVPLEGIRSSKTALYDLLQKATKVMRLRQTEKKKDGIVRWTDYEIVMIDDGNKSNIHFLKEKSLNSPPAMKFSYTDGLKKVDYINKPKPTFARVGNMKFKIGNEPNGRIALEKNNKSSGLPKLRDYEANPGQVNNAVINELERLRIYDNKKIKITATKGHYLALGDIVFLDVDDPEIRGPHKVTSKTLSIGKNMDVNLVLNDRIETMDEAESQ